MLARMYTFLICFATFNPLITIVHKARGIPVHQVNKQVKRPPKLDDQTSNTSRHGNRRG